MARPRVHVGDARKAASPDGRSRALPPTPVAGTVRHDRRGMPVAIEWLAVDGTVSRTKDVRFLNKAPGAAADIARALARLFLSNANEMTVVGRLFSLKQSLVRFLSTTSARRRLGLADLTPWHIEELTDMLRRDAALTDPGRATYYGSVVWLLRRVEGTPEIPPSPFEAAPPRRARSVSHADLPKVLTAAVRDALLHIARHRALADEGHPLWGDPVAARWLRLVRELKVAFPKRRAPSRPEVDASSPHLRPEVEALGLAELRRWWGPCLGNLGGFTLLLLYFFRLNVSMVATMRRGEVARIRDDIVIGKRKKRSRRRQTPGYPHGDERMGPEIVRTFLEEWTADARSVAPGAAQPLMVVCWRYKGEAAPTTTLEPRMSITKGFDALQRTYGLPPITPAMLRPTGIDVVDRATGGDVEITAATGQHLPMTSRRSYRTEASIRREQTRLGVAQSVRRRDYRIRLAVAAPGRVGTVGVRAATPGWFCGNPHLRLFSEAGEGEMCDAVGRCPACPVGRPDLGCPYSLAHSLAVRAAIEVKIERGGPSVRGEWRPVADRLDIQWLPSFEPAVRAMDPLPAVALLVGTF